MLAALLIFADIQDSALKYPECEADKYPVICRIAKIAVDLDRRGVKEPTEEFKAELAKLPPCKGAKPTCKVDERMWPKTGEEFVGLAGDIKTPITMYANKADRHSVRSRGYVWFRSDFSNVVNVKYRERRTRMIFDCDAEEIGVQMVAQYMPDGSTDTTGLDRNPSMEPAIPGSVGQNLIDFACKPR